MQVTLPVLSSETGETLDHPLTKAELASVINLLKTSKTPGNDGCRAEFYGKYANVLAERLLEVIEEALILGWLPPTMCKTEQGSL
ncbi:hypothetical protein NDU88_008108 [Pleurodeles waltl]|uniref:Uncharacterized protein n=1 Tax=Pleurodeles waltl TaxID=8319 RepID=A0AAV7RTT2_PLEWA|nr:hypothetical protein NDU88_008108 [Pleurodeles waltl]